MCRVLAGVGIRTPLLSAFGTAAPPGPAARAFLPQEPLAEALLEHTLRDLLGAETQRAVPGSPQSTPTRRRHHDVQSESLPLLFNTPDVVTVMVDSATA